MSNTATRGSPVPYGDQVAPASVELKTPMSVPANKLFEFPGSIANALTGIFGIPFAAAVQLAAAGFATAPVRFEIFHTERPAPSAAKYEKATYATSLLFGSNMTRPTNLVADVVTAFAGNEPLMFTSVEEPLAVANTCPFRKPTMR